MRTLHLYRSIRYAQSYTHTHTYMYRAVRKVTSPPRVRTNRMLVVQPISLNHFYYESMAFLRFITHDNNKNVRAKQAFSSILLPKR